MHWLKVHLTCIAQFAFQHVAEESQKNYDDAIGMIFSQMCKPQRNHDHCLYKPLQQQGKCIAQWTEPTTRGDTSARTIFILSTARIIHSVIYCSVHWIIHSVRETPSNVNWHWITSDFNCGQYLGKIAVHSDIKLDPMGRPVFCRGQWGSIGCQSLLLGSDEAKWH